MVTNVGIAVKIGSQAQSVQLLFPFPVLVAAILIFGIRSTSGNVGRLRAVSTVAYPSRAHENMGVEVEVEIAAPSLTGQKLFPLPA